MLIITILGFLWILLFSKLKQSIFEPKSADNLQHNTAQSLNKVDRYSHSYFVPEHTPVQYRTIPPSNISNYLPSTPVRKYPEPVSVEDSREVELSPEGRILFRIKREIIFSNLQQETQQGLGNYGIQKL